MCWIIRGQRALIPWFGPKFIFPSLCSLASIRLRPSPRALRPSGCRFPFGRLDAGDYPYPFWHAAKKWNAYHTCADLVFVFKNQQIVGALRSAETKAEPVAIRKVKWDKKWSWTDEKTHTEQPHVALYTHLFSAGNPYTEQLDGAFRTLAKGLQKAECLDCHRPDNHAQDEDVGAV